MNPVTRRRLIYAAPLGMVAVGGASFWAMLSGMQTGAFNPRGVPSALLGKAAPTTSLAALDGYTGFTDADLRAPSAPMLVNFFASWCSPCVIEHPQFMALSQQGVRLLGVAYKNRPEDARTFLTQRGNPYAAVVTDLEGRVSLDWGLYGVPETYLIDKTGIIRWRMAGPITPEIMADSVLPLLRKYG